MTNVASGSDTAKEKVKKAAEATEAAGKTVAANPPDATSKAPLEAQVSS